MSASAFIRFIGLYDNEEGLSLFERDIDDDVIYRFQ